MARCFGLVAAVLLAGTAAHAESLHDVGVRALQQQAGLDAEHAAGVQAVVERYHQKMAPLRREDRRIVRRLRGGRDDAHARQLTARLLDNRRSLATLRDERLAEIGKLLRPAELGRVLAAMPSIDRTVRRAARDARTSGS